jgi:hypothetical protein
MFATTLLAFSFSVAFSNALLIPNRQLSSVKLTDVFTDIGLEETCAQSLGDAFLTSLFESCLPPVPVLLNNTWSPIFETVCNATCVNALTAAIDMVPVSCWTLTFPEITTNPQTLVKNDLSDFLGLICVTNSNNAFCLQNELETSAIRPLDLVDGSTDLTNLTTRFVSNLTQGTFCGECLSLQTAYLVNTTFSLMNVTDVVSQLTLVNSTCPQTQQTL